MPFQKAPLGPLRSVLGFFCFSLEKAGTAKLESLSVLQQDSDHLGSRSGGGWRTAFTGYSYVTSK